MALKRFGNYSRNVYKQDIQSNFMEREMTIREEANALICCAVRNGYIEDLHAGKHSKLLETPGLSRITDTEMKKLMIESTAKLAELLDLKQENPNEYWRRIRHFNEKICYHWDKGGRNSKNENRSLKNYAEKQKAASQRPLPLPTVDLGDDLPKDLDKWTIPQARALVCNPLIAGVGHHRPLVTEEDWVRDAVANIAKEGAEQFLVNMLAVLRKEWKSGR